MTSRASPLDEPPIESLTWRERDVLLLLGERLSNQEIASRLHLAESTVKDYVGSILAKLYVKNRREAIERAKALGLLDADQSSGIAPPTNLPAEATPFVGRSNELAEIRRLLRESRLLTLIGPGGIGKTRLALKAAEQAAGGFRDGSFFVSLAPIASVEQITQAIAEAARFPISTSEDPQYQLLRYLRRKQMLITLDNFEHLLAGANILSEILHVAPGIKILVTSRERLKLQGETILQIAGMALPDEAQPPDLQHEDAVTLFLQSAAKVRTAFSPSAQDQEHIRKICQLVLGMPLAIELAASWLHTLTVGEIGKELERGLNILAADWPDAPARHRSIRATFDHSWTLLNSDERDVLMRLSVFRGGFTREAAEQVTGASLTLLRSLVDKSILQSAPDSGRFEMHELLRQHAQERLEHQTPAAGSAREAHASFFSEFMKGKSENLKGKRQIAALAELEADLENIRAGWQYYIERADARRLQNYMQAFWLFYWIRGSNRAAVELFTQAVEVLGQARGDAETDAARGTAMAHQAHFLAWIGLAEQGFPLARESVQILERLHDSDGLVFAYNSLDLISYYLGWLEQEREAADKLVAVARASDDRWVMAFALFVSGSTSFRAGDYEKAEQLLQTGLKLADEMGDGTVSVLSQLTLGHLAVARGGTQKARECFQRCLRISRQMGFRWAIANSTKYLGQVALLEGNISEAEGYFLQGLRIAYDLALDRDIINYLYELARVRVAQDRLEEAVGLLALLLQQPASRQAGHFAGHRQGPIGGSAHQVLNQIMSLLSPQAYAIAMASASKMELDQTIHELIGALSLHSLR
jgi:predicted ATPase/DNA-binding CsgD family transcriptional regulator